MDHLKEAISIILLAFRGFERKHLSLVAAGLAYFFLMSLFPALVLLTAIVAYLPLQNAIQGTNSLLAHVIPRPALSMIEPMLTTIGPHRTGLLSFGVIATIWLTSIGAKGIIAGLDIVYEVRAPRRVWTNRVLAFALTLGVGLLLLLAIAFTLTGPILEALFAAVVPVQSLWIRMWPYIQWLFSAAFTFAAIELLYLLAPNVPASRRLTIPGALVAAFGWLASSWGLSFYLYHFGQLKLDRLYGILATPIALMIWLNWGAAAILIGAEINVSLQSLHSPNVSDPEQILQRRSDAA